MPSKFVLPALLLGSMLVATPAYAYDPTPDPRLADDTGSGADRDYGASRSRPDTYRRRDDAWDTRRITGQPDFGGAASKRERSAGRPITD